jgi:7-cyano-7-deazaguanine reductase
MVKIEDIASVHLGKAGDGSVVKPYVTPDNIDPSLLVGVPRHLNRTAYGIDDNNLPFTGFDTWNCYEFSTLTTNGFPICGVIRCVYPSNSPNIVESKSLKLYMNSYNMARLGDSVDGAIYTAEDRIQEDVAKALGLEDKTQLQISFCNEGSQMTTPISFDMHNEFIPLEYHVNVESIVFNQYNESPDILEVVDTVSTAEHNWRSAVLRSNCRVTNQPDWGDVYISIKGNKTVTPESLLQYIVSMRRENHFHEEICECIYKRLYDLLGPDKLFVACLYTRRGGIDINPARATDHDTLMMYANGLSISHKLNMKTLRQ